MHRRGDMVLTARLFPRPNNIIQSTKRVVDRRLASHRPQTAKYRGSNVFAGERLNVNIEWMNERRRYWYCQSSNNPIIAFSWIDGVLYHGQKFHGSGGAIVLADTVPFLIFLLEGSGIALDENLGRRRKALIAAPTETTWEFLDPFTSEKEKIKISV